MGPDICAEEGFPSPQTHPRAPRAAAPHAHRRAGISSPPLFISFPRFREDFFEAEPLELFVLH